jgi:hypothetical protein
MSEVKLLGMEPEKGRWVLVLAGLIINIALGAIYAYSIIQIPIRKLFETDSNRDAVALHRFSTPICTYNAADGEIYRKARA